MRYTIDSVETDALFMRSIYLEEVLKAHEKGRWAELAAREIKGPLQRLWAAVSRVVRKVRRRPPKTSVVLIRKDGRIRIRSKGDPLLAGPAGMTDEDWLETTKLIAKLLECPIPDEVFHVMFAANGWTSPFPGLRAIWLPNPKIVIFYGAGLGASFHHWAAAFQPNVADDLEGFDDGIVVAIPAVAKMTPELLKFLEDNRSKSWRRYRRF